MQVYSKHISIGIHTDTQYTQTTEKSMFAQIQTQEHALNVPLVFDIERKYCFY